MRMVLSLDVMRQAIRTGVCPGCQQRGIDSDLLPAGESRSCESQCAVFLNLARMLDVVRELDPVVGTFGHAVDALICTQCNAMPASAHCSPPTNRHCPLASNRDRVVRVLGGLLQAAN